MPAEMSYCVSVSDPAVGHSLGLGESATFEFPDQLERNQNFAHQPAFSFHRIDVAFPATGPTIIRGVRCVDAGSRGVRVRSSCARSLDAYARLTESAERSDRRLQIRSTCSRVYALS